MPEPNKTTLCFCTAAFGRDYLRLARLLAQDLEKFAPHYPFVVYTHCPDFFQDCRNVIAIQHSPRGVMSHHERRFAIWRSLEFAPSVMYLDADVRICAPIPETLQFPPGLSARSCSDLQKHLKQQFDRSPLSSTRQHKKRVIEKMADYVGIDLQTPGLKFINEFLFVITADQGRERQFLNLWGELAIYADTLGMHKHPTYAMGLAAAKHQFPIYYHPMEGLDFFDDRVEKFKISQGKASPQDKAQYFQQQNSIEQNKNILKRARQAMVGKLLLFYHRARVSLFYRFWRSHLLDYSPSKGNHHAPSLPDQQS